MKPLSILSSIIAVFLLVGCADSVTTEVEERSSEETNSSQSDTVIFGIYTADKASDVVEEFAPIIEWLEDAVNESLETPIKIQMKIANNYLAGISNIATGEAHLSRLGPASYIHASDENPDLEILTMESKGGNRSFDGIIAVHTDSDIQRLADLRGRSFAFGSPLSTIGRYLSQDLLIAEGIYSGDLAHHAFLDRHDTVGMAVAAKDFDAGALKSSSFKSLVADGHPIRKLVAFDNVTKPWIAHPGLKPEIRAAIKKAMLEISMEDAELIGVDGFLDSGPEYYRETGEAMERSKAFDLSLSANLAEPSF